MRTLVSVLRELSMPRTALVCALIAASVASHAADPPELAELEPLAAGVDFHAINDELAWLVNVALPQNPTLRAVRADWRARRARIDQARALPDPTATYRYFGGSPETRVGPQVQSLELRQSVPWMGKRSLQSHRAALEADGAGSGVRDLERALVRELKRMYFEAAYMLEALAVNADEAALLRRFEQIALTRYSTGAGIQQAVIKIQTEVSRLADDEIFMRRTLDHLTHGMARLLGDPDRTLLLDPIVLALPEVDLTAVRTEHAALTGHSRTQALRAKIDADRTWTRRKQLDGKPDLAFDLSYTEVGRRDDVAGILNPPQGNGHDIWALGVQLNIPIYRRKVRAGVVEAQETQRASERRLRDMEDRLTHEIHGAVLRVESLERRVRLHQEVIIPQAGESLASAEAAYTTNRQDILGLLDAQRVLFQARLTSHRLMADVWIALADLEFALGRKFPDSGSTGERQP